jgi:diguanylate cyclase (GGDEF)-like protein
MARLRQLTRTDSLTGLPNRRAADEMIEQLREANDRLGEPACLLVIDADHFKRVNDQHGHLVGDRALVHLAAVLRAGLRGADVVARVGGEELLVLLPQTERATAMELAERLRARVEAQPLRSGSREVPLTISIGVALLRAGEGGEAWQARADAAMYRAKQQGRNRVCVEGEGP